MKLELSLKDKNGLDLSIGDTIELFDWGFDYIYSLGSAILIWDSAEGRLSTEPCLVEDPYDFFTKALPRCVKI